MPPPFAITIYRGYELVQWYEGGSVEICLRDGTHVSTGRDYDDALAIVDGWHLAP